MSLNYFKDKVFDLLNDSEDIAVSDIVTNDKEDRFMISLQSGSLIEIKFREMNIPLFKDQVFMDSTKQ